MPAARVWQQEQVALLSSYVQLWITVKIVGKRATARIALSLFVVMVLVCCDPFCALQAYFEGVKASSNFNIIALDHKKKLKNNTFGHFDNEIDFDHTEGFEGTEVDHIKPQKIVLVSPLVTV